MIIGLTGLLIRRFAVNRVRYISAPSDYAMLILLLLIGISGAMMTFVDHVDVVGVKSYFHAWMTFDIENLILPSDMVLRIHLFLVAVLMLIFPISKLLHAPGIFFSPTRNQADNPREVRHVAEWAEKLSK
jgi:nitrate reductase gamma subunit